MATLSAYIIEKILNNPDEKESGYMWSSSAPDGKKYRSVVSGCLHSDMQIYRRDETEYPTIDPFGNASYIRPMRESTEILASRHSVEANFLAILLKYVDQTKLRINFLSTEKNRKSFIQSLKNQEYSGGTCAEHFFGAMATRDARFQMNMEFPKTMTKW